MKQRQQGQVLPLGIALLALMLLGTFVLYSTGQVATDKLKLANAADAAAYSGSLWQARAMNYQAYTNRAMVANQVSVAQAVTLQSWASYGAVASENISTVLKPVPVLNVVAQGLSSGLDSVERILSPIAGALLTVVDVVNRGLSISQEAMFVSAFVATPDVVRAVVSESDSRFSVDTAYSGIGIAKNLEQWYSFTTRFTDEDIEAMQTRAAMINDSRDDFTRERNWKFFKNFWFYSTPLTRHRLYREGTTELILVENDGKAQWEWKAKDTLSLHNRLWRWRGSKRYEIPIGWAEAFANSESSTSTIDPDACTSALEFQQSSQCSQFLSMNRNAEYLADTGVRSPLMQKETQVAMRGFNGIQAFRSLSEQTLNEELPRIQLKVEVSMPAEAISSADSSQLGDTFKSPVKALGDVVSSISTAEVYYQRPDSDGENTLNKANAYSPYWSARLSAVSESDRLLATSFRDFSDTLSAPGAIADGLSGLSQYQPATQSSASFETVLAAQQTYPINQYENVIQGELNSALSNSIAQLLADTVSENNNSLLSGNIPTQDEFEQYAQNALADQSGSEAAQPYQEAVDEAERLGQELNDEFLRIRQQVSDDFEVAYAQIRSELNDEINALNNEASDIRQYVDNAPLNEETTDDYESRIAALNLQATELESGFNDALATRLVEIVGNATTMYSMSFTEALYTVEEWMRSDGNEVSLPWTEVMDDE